MDDIENYVYGVIVRLCTEIDCVVHTAVSHATNFILHAPQAVSRITK